MSFITYLIVKILKLHSVEKHLFLNIFVKTQTLSNLMHCLISKIENYCLISASSLKKLWRESVLQVSLLVCYFAHALFVHMLHDYYSLYVVYAMFYENKFIFIVIDTLEHVPNTMVLP